MVFNPTPPRTENVEGKGEEGRGAVPGRLIAVRKSLHGGKAWSRTYYRRFVGPGNRGAELYAMAGDPLPAHGRGSPPASCSFRRPHT